MPSFKINEKKRDLINRHGETFGLPLFDKSASGYYPNWLCTGSSVKAEVWSKIKNTERLNEDAWKILNTMINRGGHLTDNEIEEATGFRINIITGRRNDLCEAGLVTGLPPKTKTGKSGRPNKVWHVNYKNLYNRINGM